jgi:hypothetical protein
VLYKHKKKYPIKLICILGFIISLAGIILSTIFQSIANTIFGFIITICIIIAIVSLGFLADGFTEINDILETGRIAGLVFILMIIISFIPLIFTGLESFFLKGLTFWF